MKVIGLIAGFVGLALLCPALAGRGSGILIAVAVVLIVVGALVFMLAGQDEKRARTESIEERRHQELIEAMRRQK